VEKNVIANSDEPDSEHLQNRIAHYLHTEYPKKI
jgi:ribosomal protein S17E